LTTLHKGGRRELPSGKLGPERGVQKDGAYMGMKETPLLACERGDLQGGQKRARLVLTGFLTGEAQKKVESANISPHSTKEIL